MEAQKAYLHPTEQTEWKKNLTFEKKENSEPTTAYGRLVEKLHFSYFGLISMNILIGSIIGGISAMYVFENHAPLWEFVLCLTVALASLVASISQASTKWVLNLAITNLVVNTILILINAF